MTFDGTYDFSEFDQITWKEGWALTHRELTVLSAGRFSGWAEQQLSQAAHDRLKAEHDDLTTRGRIDIARKIETAREPR